MAVGAPSPNPLPPEGGLRKGSLDGLLLADKPVGWTSHDVVAVLRTRLPRGHKVGHAGTLDPKATGLLLLLLGRATRSSAALLGLDKVYAGSLRLGVETDTGDLEGRIVRESPLPPLSPEALREAFAAHLGALELPVPAYSAVKHEGRNLYDYARKGEAVPVKTRTTDIHAFDLLSWASPEASFRLACSSGTYVRAVAESVGRRLGCGAVLSALRRESIGSWRVEDARPVAELKGLGADAISALLLPIPSGLDLAPHGRAS